MKILVGTAALIVFLLAPFYAFSQSVTFTDFTMRSRLNNYRVARASAWLDYDRDGYLDLFVGSEVGANRLHRNNGDGTFTNMTVPAWIPQRTGVWGVNFADIDNDGYEDIYMSTRAPDTVSAGRNVLLHNNGLGNFVNISDSSGANVPGGGVAACFAPFSKGPYVDLFVPNQYYPDLEYPVMLYNAGNRTFTDRTFDVGLRIPDWWDIPLVFDYDNDGTLELFCTKDYNGNSMYDRVEGHYFSDISDSLNFQTPCGYGATVGDINNDGWFDLFITNWHNILDNLFLYDDEYCEYDDVSHDWGARGNTWTSAAHFADFDNDGWLDLFVVGAGTGNKYYQNVSGTDYEDMTAEVGLTNFNYNWGVSIGDYDNDGFLDIYIPEYHQSANGGKLYHNNGNDNNWVKYELQGVRSNRDGIGAKLIVESSLGSQIRQVMAGSGFGSQNSLIQHFGMAGDSIVSSLTINWPSGQTDVYFDMSVNTSYLLVEGLVTVVDGEEGQTPAEFVLGNATPNPFNGATRIDVKVYRPTALKAEIVDILGRVIKTIYEGSVESSTLALTWDGEDESGQAMSSGVYFCRVSDGIRTASSKLLLQK